MPRSETSSSCNMLPNGDGPSVPPTLPGARAIRVVIDDDKAVWSKPSRVCRAIRWVEDNAGGYVSLQLYTNSARSLLTFDKMNRSVTATIQGEVNLDRPGGSLCSSGWRSAFDGAPQVRRSSPVRARSLPALCASSVYQSSCADHVQLEVQRGETITLHSGGHDPAPSDEAPYWLYQM